MKKGHLLSKQVPNVMKKHSKLSWSEMESYTSLKVTEEMS
jgi:hypothetical protein